MLSDPILDHIGEGDASLLQRILDALIELDKASAAAVAAYSELPTQQFERLAKLDSDLRVLIAERPDCPVNIAGQLVEDPDPEVRRALASNPSVTFEHLLMLASDTNEWVRWRAYRNPRAQDEHRTAVALLGQPEHLQVPEQSECLDPATSTQRLRELTLTSAVNPNRVDLRVELATNPTLPPDCVPALIDAAIVQREWSALWKRHGQLWPSTYAFMNPETPNWVLDVLQDHGHPAALLSASASYESAPASPIDSIVQLINSELLVRALWRELAMEQAVELLYWHNSEEGDKFYPCSPSVTLLDPHSPAHAILGGYSENREWIETESYLSEENALRVAAQWFEGEGPLSRVDFDQDSLDLLTIAGIAYITEFESEGESDISITESGLRILNQVVERGDVYADHNDFDTIVRVVDTKLPGVTYAGTSTPKKSGLVKLLQSSRKDPMIEAWGISNHFLKCIAVHPDTPYEIRQELQADEDFEVQLAAQISANGSQRGIAQKPQSTAGRINTLVYSTLIPEGRLEEARIWLSQIIDYEFDYEFWNALSNLGVVEYLSGRSEVARNIFETVRVSGDGPTFEAEEYLALIEAGEVLSGQERPHYSDEWRQFPIEGATPHDDQQTHYLRSLRILEANVNAETLVNSWLQGRGEYATAFVDSATDSEGVAELGISRETIAKSLVDYVETVLMQMPEASVARQQGMVELAAGNRPRAEILFRRAAVQGDREAASLLASMLIADGHQRTGQAWRNVSDDSTL